MNTDQHDFSRRVRRLSSQQMGSTVAILLGTGLVASILERPLGSWIGIVPVVAGLATVGVAVRAWVTGRRPTTGNPYAYERNAPVRFMVIGLVVAAMGAVTLMR